MNTVQSCCDSCNEAYVVRCTVTMNHGQVPFNKQCFRPIVEGELEQQWQLKSFTFSLLFFFNWVKKREKRGLFTTVLAWPAMAFTSNDQGIKKMTAPSVYNFLLLLQVEGNHSGKVNFSFVFYFLQNFRGKKGL